MYDNKIKKQLIRALLEGKPGAEHERLNNELKNWAQSRNYILEFRGFSNGLKPDVLMGHDDKLHLFVGDAKDSNNENPSNNETLSRIQSYFCEFAKLLGQGNYKNGILAIATNSLESAREWVPTLNFLAKIAGITGGNGKEPDFKIENTNPEKTWIIWW